MYARVASAVVCLFCFYFPPSRCARAASAIVISVFFPNAPARVTNFSEAAGLAVILKGLIPLV